MSEKADHHLQFMMLMDFAAEDSYVRISKFEELRFCEKIDMSLQKLSPVEADSMVLTFYNYQEVSFFII